MCKCTPAIRTMFCGQPGCELPDSWKKKEDKQQLISERINESSIRPLQTIGKLYRDDLGSGRRDFTYADVNLLVTAIENLFKVD